MFEKLFRRVPDRWQKDEFEDEAQAEIFSLYMRKIKWLAKTAGFLGGALSAIFLLAAIFQAGKPFRPRVLLAPLLIGSLCSAMVTGFVLLTAPYEFFASKEGRQYLWAIGTHNTFVARVVVFIGLAIGFAALWFLGIAAFEILTN